MGQERESFEVKWRSKTILNSFPFLPLLKSFLRLDHEWLVSWVDWKNYFEVSEDSRRSLDFWWSGFRVKMNSTQTARTLSLPPSHPLFHYGKLEQTRKWNHSKRWWVESTWFKAYFLPIHSVSFHRTQHSIPRFPLLSCHLAVLWLDPNHRYATPFFFRSFGSKTLSWIRKSKSTSQGKIRSSWSRWYHCSTRWIPCFGEKSRWSKVGSSKPSKVSQSSFNNDQAAVVSNSFGDG